MKSVEGMLISGLAAPGMPMPPPPMYPAPMYPPPMYPPQQKSGSKIAGIMYILGGVFLLITLIFGIIVATAGSIMGSVIDDYQSFATYLWAVCVVLPLVGMIFGFLGAVFAFQGKKFTIALVGGILGMVAGIASGIIVYGGNVGYNWLGLLAFIFFLIGVIMVFTAKKNFN
jgi:hypothetical protein